MLERIFPSAETSTAKMKNYEKLLPTLGVPNRPVRTRSARSGRLNRQSGGETATNCNPTAPCVRSAGFRVDAGFRGAGFRGADSVARGSGGVVVAAHNTSKLTTGGCDSCFVVVCILRSSISALNLPSYRLATRPEWRQAAQGWSGVRFSTLKLTWARRN